MSKTEYKIQSVLFNRDKYTPNEAIQWLIHNSFKVKKIDGTKSLWRFRQYSPAVLRKQGYEHYAHKEISDGISFVLAYKS
jgi:hypothetical protein